MRFFSAVLFVWFFLVSLILPLIHLAEAYHVEKTGEKPTHEASGFSGCNEIFDFSDCKNYILSFHSDRISPSFKGIGERMVFLKEWHFQANPKPRERLSVLPRYGGSDPPPLFNTYDSLVWIIKNQVYDISL